MGRWRGLLRGKQRDHTAARCPFDARSQTPPPPSGRWSCQTHPPGLLTLLHLALRCHGMTSSHCDVTTTPLKKKKKTCSHLLPSPARGIWRLNIAATLKQSKDNLPRGCTLRDFRGSSPQLHFSSADI